MAKKLLKRTLWWLVGIAALIVYNLAFRFPYVVERFYSRGIYPVLTKIFSHITKYIPFSISEVLIYLLVIGAVVYLVFFIRSFFGKDKLRRILTKLIALVTAACFAYAVFVFGWALNYARLPLSSSSGLDVRPSEDAELIALCETLAEQANTMRPHVTEDENGVYTLSRDLSEICADVQTLYDAHAAEIMNLGGSSRVKPVFTDHALSYVETMGIFSPFTYECHINAEMPDLYQASTVAHEYAHFKGFAREDEANFIAWYTCYLSEDIDFAYSGVMMALNNAMNNLSIIDPAAHSRIYRTLDEGLLRDWQEYAEYWIPFHTKFAEQSGEAYDNYLKSNGIPDGSKSYGRMLDLILAMQREGLIFDNPHY